MVEAGRVAEIIAEFPKGTERGSGYRTSDTTVLTAAHVVANATRVRIRFDADTDDEWETVATAVWSDAASDLAVLSIESRAEDLPPAKFGRIGDRDAVLPATAVGFPLFKLKNYDGTVLADDGRPRYRDTHHATGMVAALSNRREGTLEFTVAPPDRDADPEPWQGMSGAALWMGDRIVGVIARHHRTDGLGRLTAVRLDRALTAEPRELLGITGTLPDAVRPHESELVRTDYRKQVEAIAPRQLLDREDELAELIRFVAGDAPYTRWLAGPWAGKSALMSWFVLHPPEGVDVVSFFVTRSLGGQEDSDAFTKALTQQLAALTGEPPSDDGRQLWRLFDEAGTRSRRLLVVIDGLDEDSGPAHGKPSIASLLPLRPPQNVRILVASRPDPRVPDDVIDEDHPLLTCPRRDLTASPYAGSIGRRATHELNQHLRGDELDRDVLGLITASGGGLTRRDLEELTGQPPYEIDRLLDGPLGRTFSSRPAPLCPDENKPIHLFAHETLGATARDKFGTSVQAYRTRISIWADTYQQKGWPPDTPQYLLIGYLRMLVEAGDHDRLVAVSTDRARHERMLLASGGDALATSEVRHAQDVLSRLPSPDLSGLLLLAAHNDELNQRNSGIPVRLPLVWAMLGDTARGEALARGITDRAAQARSLTALAAFAAQTGDHKRFRSLVTDAQALAKSVHYSHSRNEVLSELATAAAEAGEPDLAIAIAQQIPDSYPHDEVLGALAGSAAEGGDLELARRFVAGITGSHNRSDKLAELVRAAATAGQFEQAGSFLDAIAESYVRASVVDEFVRDAIAADDHERTHRFLRATVDPDVRAGAMAAVAAAAATEGTYEHALAFARDISEPALQATTMVRLGTAARDAGNRDRAVSLLEEAWACTHGIIDHHARAWTKITVLEAVAVETPAMLTDAEEAVRAVPDVGYQAELLSRLAEVSASARERDRAGALLRAAAELVDRLTERESRDDRRPRVLRSAVEVGEFEWAVGWLDGIVDRDERAAAMIELVAAAGPVHRERASSLLDEASTLARTLDDEAAGDRLHRMATAATRIGDHERALALVNDIVNTMVRDEVLTDLVEAAKAEGDLERASWFARHVTDDDDHGQVLAELAEEIAAAGDHDRALLLARDIRDASNRDDALKKLAEQAAKAGAYERARELASSVMEGMGRLDVLATLTEIAADKGAWDEAATFVRDGADDQDADPDTLVRLVLAVAEAGAPELARTLAQEVSDPDELPDALTRLAEAALSAGDRERARALLAEVATVTSTLPDPENWSYGLGKAVEVAVAVGEHERALAFARAIAHPYEQAGALTRLAEVAAEAGDHRGARELGVEAESCARHVTGVMSHGAFLGLAAASLLIGEQDRARRLVQRVPSTEMRSDLLAQLAIASAADPATAHSLLTDAVTAAEGVPDPRDRGEALTELVDVADEVGQADLLRSVVARAEDAIAEVTEVAARTLPLARLASAAAKAGHHDAARALLTEAESLVSAMPELEGRENVLAKLADAATATGALRRAQDIASRIADPFARHDALTALARAADEAGEHELARSVASGVDDSFRRHNVLRALMEQATTAGEHDRARSLAMAATDWYEQAEMLTWMSCVATAMGDHERALALVRAIPRRYGPNEALRWLVRAAVAGGDHERARALVEDITGYNRTLAEPYLSGETPATPGLYSEINPIEPLVDIMIAAGDRVSALAVAHDLDDTLDRTSTLAKLVDAEIAAGDAERALTVAREITNPVDRATALSSVVEAVAASGAPARARTLLAEVLVLASWHDSVRLVAKVAPDALVPVLDELEARCLSQ